MLHLRTFATVMCFLLAACATPTQRGAFADENGDPARGRAYAQDHCAACHAVGGGAGEQSPNPAAPAFREVANTPGFTRTALGAWLRSSHQQMPSLIVESDRIDDIYVYLETLRAPRSTASQSTPR